MCNIALKYPIERKNEGKRGVPLVTKCNLISMEIKVNQKNDHPGDQDLDLFVATFDMTSVMSRF